VRDVQITRGITPGARHPRAGIWIVDDLGPCGALGGAAGEGRRVVPGRPVQQRLIPSGGWVEGDASFVGDNAPAGAVSLLPARPPLVGPIKLELLDSSGALVDTLPASNRRGSTGELVDAGEAPRVPGRRPWLQLLAGGGVVPGTYTVRLTKGSQTLETKLDRPRPPRPVHGADRKAHFDAAMKAHALFGTMSELVDRIDAAAKAARASKQEPSPEARRGEEDLATKEAGRSPARSDPRAPDTSRRDPQLGGQAGAVPGGPDRGAPPRAGRRPRRVRGVMKEGRSRRWPRMGRELGRPKVPTAGSPSGGFPRPVQSSV